MLNFRQQPSLWIIRLKQLGAIVEDQGCQMDSLFLCGQSNFFKIDLYFYIIES